MTKVKSLYDISWQVIPGLESYAASNTGEIKALSKVREGNLQCLKNMSNRQDTSKRHYKERVLKQQFKQRYYYVNLMHNGIKKDYRVHRLIYLAFYGEIPKGMTIDHIDGNTKNNHISNLRCVTMSENCQNPNTISKHFKPVLQIDINTDEIIAEFPSCRDALIALGFKYKPSITSHIGDVCNNKRITCYGYKWKWKEISL